MSLVFTPNGGTAVTVTPIIGTLQYGDGHDDKGGGNIPNARNGIAKNGSCEALIDSASGLTMAAALALVSPTGEGNVDITGDAASFDALVDVEITGDAVQIAKISWKGTIAPAA